ncbi:MAG: hypothetical protein HY445_00830 [Candidatus Niyogibacteria bacterium]|nr:hypothetical protein [Candidatus Niyogibacteria bacterium]
MIQKTETCQNCKNKFVIEPEDFSFYEKIQVPPPTWCPDCRSQRRLVWRNERILYKRKNDAPNKDELLISNHSSDFPAPIYDQDYWRSDNWDPLSYGQEYDFNKPFFQQFKELLQKVPRMNLTNLQSVNSEYCNFTYQAKNCYLNFASDINEDTAYVYHTIYCKNSLDLLSCRKTEWCSEGIHSQDSYETSYFWFSKDCIDSRLLYNCHNCQSCVGCVNLRNAKYQIFNQQYGKDEYLEKVKTLNLGSHNDFQKAFRQFTDLIVRFPHKFANIIQARNVSGDYITNSKNCYFCFDIEGPVEDCKYIIYGVPNLRDCYDGYGTGNGMEMAYEVTSAGGNAQRIFFSPMAWTGDYYFYSHLCEGSSNIFGCVGLRQKRYCILNKQYTKESFDKLRIKIMKHMEEMPYTDKKGKVYKYGEFFPPELSPFSYNETIAQEYFPLTKEQAIEKGYKWKDPEPRNYQITTAHDQLPDHIKDVDDSILNQTVGCQHQGKCNEQCSEAFKIIPQELQFYRKMNLPLPRLCPNCRHYRRIKQRNPLKLWYRICQCSGIQSDNKVYTNTADHIHHSKIEHCPNELETTYAPERPEIVYCEQCYNAEVV